MLSLQNWAEIYYDGVEFYATGEPYCLIYRIKTDGEIYDVRVNRSSTQETIMLAVMSQQLDMCRQQVKEHAQLIMEAQKLLISLMAKERQILVS